MGRRGIAVLAVAALLCGCEQGDPPTPEEMMKRAEREGFVEYRSAMTYWEDPTKCAPVHPQDEGPVPEPVPPKALRASTRSYSPECVEQEFSAVHVQELSLTRAVY
jgi:hypothetical protein